MTTIAATEQDHQPTVDDAKTEPIDAQLAAVGLRALANFLDANPDLPGIRWAFHGVNVFPRDRDGVAAWARAAMRSTGKARKHQHGQWAGLDVDFSPAVSIAVRIERDEVCQRVVVATREETKEVPDPTLLAAVPTVTVTEVVEDVEWRCMPILSDLDRPGDEPSS